MTLVGNRTFIQRIQASVGVPITSDSEDPAYINFNQVIFLFLYYSSICRCSHYQSPPSCLTTSERQTGDFWKHWGNERVVSAQLIQTRKAKNLRVGLLDPQGSLDNICFLEGRKNGGWE